MSTTLVLVIPLLVVPVVLLLAFAGCTPFDAAEEPKPPEPTPTPTPPPTPTPTPTPTPVPTPTGPVYGATVLATTGLTAYWRLDEPAGATALLDSGPLKVDGLYRAPGVTLGQPGVLSARDVPNVCASFDGGLAQVTFDARLNPGANLVFTVEAWVRPAPGGAALQTIVSSRQFVNGGFNGYDLLLRPVAGDAPEIVGRVFAGGTGPRNQIVVADPGSDPEAWRHVAFTYDRGTLDLVVTIPGATPATAPSSTAPLYRPVTAGSFRLGAGHQDAAAPINLLSGMLDEVAFYTARLSTGQIAEHVTAAR